MSKVLDRLGNEIVEGCIIIYPTLDYRIASLRVAKVLSVKDDRLSAWAIDDDDPERHSPRITLSNRKSSFSFPEKVVVPIELLPADYKAIFGMVNEDTKRSDLELPDRVWI